MRLNTKIKNFCPFNFSKIESKKAQSGETVTWIIATLIIVTILLIAIYASFILAKGQKIITVGKNPSALNFKYSGTSNLLATKCLTGLLSTNENGQVIFLNLPQFNNFNGNLANNIFMPFKEDYSIIWLGIDKQKNNYFGEEPGISINDKIQINMKLSNNKDLQLVMVK